MRDCPQKNSIVNINSMQDTCLLLSISEISHFVRYEIIYFVNCEIEN